MFQIVGEDGDQSVGSPSGAREKRSGMAVSAEEQSRRDAMDMRCLSLCIGMLERVNGVCHFGSCSCFNSDKFIQLDLRREFNARRSSKRADRSCSPQQRAIPSREGFDLSRVVLSHRKGMLVSYAELSFSSLITFDRRKWLPNHFNCSSIKFPVHPLNSS